MEPSVAEGGSRDIRVLFDAYWWNEGPHSNRSVVHEFVRAWSARFPGDHVFAAMPGSDAPNPRLPQGVVPVRTRLAPHGVSASLWLPHVGRKLNADVMVAQNFTPAWGRSVVFIHDVMFQTNPEWFSPKERAYLAPIPMLARRAEVVLTSSASEADRIRRENPRLARVVPVGLSVKSSLLGAVATMPRLPAHVNSFLLSVGRLNVRKNLSTALAAAVASGTLSSGRPMLVVGEPDGPGEHFGAAVTGAIHRGEIIFLGSLSDAEIAWLYAHADCFLFLTLGEGFGLPPVEAQHFGCPVVVSDIPVMREVCQDGAVFVDPLDVDAVAQAIRNMPTNREPRVGTRPQADPWVPVVERIRHAIETGA